MTRRLQSFRSGSTLLALAGGLLTAIPDSGQAQDVPESSPMAMAAFAEGMTHYVDGDFDRAIAAFEQANAHDPTFVLALFFAGMNHSNAGRGAVADSLFTIVQRARARLSPYYQGRLDTQLAMRAGDREAAVGHARTLAEAFPGTKASYNVAQILVSLRRPREARDALLSLDPEREPMRGWDPYWLVLTRALHDLGEHEAELDMARRGREHYPDNISVAWVEAEALAALGREAELERLMTAVTAMRSRLGTTPGTVMTSVAADLVSHGRSEELAHRIYAQALRWYEDRPEAERAGRAHRNWYGLTLHGVGRDAEARQVYERLSAEVPGLPWYRGMVGVLAARTGDTLEARRVVEWLGSDQAGGTAEDRLLMRGLVAAALGENGQALRFIDAAYDRGAFNRWGHRHPTLLLLKDEPEFSELLRPRG